MYSHHLPFRMQYPSRFDLWNEHFLHTIPSKKNKKHLSISSEFTHLYPSSTPPPSTLLKIPSHHPSPPPPQQQPDIYQSIILVPNELEEKQIIPPTYHLYIFKNYLEKEVTFFLPDGEKDDIRKEFILYDHLCHPIKLQTASSGTFVVNNHFNPLILQFLPNKGWTPLSQSLYNMSTYQKRLITIGTYPGVFHPLTCHKYIQVFGDEVIVCGAYIEDGETFYTIEIIDLNTSKVVQTLFDHQPTPNLHVFSHITKSDKFIISSDNYHIKVMKKVKGFYETIQQISINDDFFASSVCISSDSSHLIVSNPDKGPGEITVYGKNTRKLFEPQKRLYDPDLPSYNTVNYLGCVCDISYDGKTIVALNHPTSDVVPKQVYIWEYSEVQQMYNLHKVKLENSYYSTERVSNCICLNSQGNIIFLSFVDSPQTTKIVKLEKYRGKWSEPETLTILSTQSQQGVKLSISSDGNHLLLVVENRILYYVKNTKDEYVLKKECQEAGTVLDIKIKDGGESFMVLCQNVANQENYIVLYE